MSKTKPIVITDLSEYYVLRSTGIYCRCKLTKQKIGCVATYIDNGMEYTKQINNKEITVVDSDVIEEACLAYTRSQYITKERMEYFYDRDYSGDSRVYYVNRKGEISYVFSKDKIKERLLDSCCKRTPVQFNDGRYMVHTLIDNKNNQIITRSWAIAGNGYLNYSDIVSVGERS